MHAVLHARYIHSSGVRYTFCTCIISMRKIIRAPRVCARQYLCIDACSRDFIFAQSLAIVERMLCIVIPVMYSLMRVHRPYGPRYVHFKPLNIKMYSKDISNTRKYYI